MHTLGTHFKELLKNIEPPQDRLDAAAEIPGDVRDFLKESQGFPTLPPHSALVGSYRRHTSIGDIKDVDIKGLPRFGIVEGYMAAGILVEGLRRTGKNPTREGLIKALEGDPIDLGGIIIDYALDNHNGTPQSLETLTKIANGKLIDL